MPNNIESRIVTMTFDNAQFEKGVATTQKSLKDLDESLKFKDVDKSFDGITKAASKVSFSQLESNIGTVGTVIEKSMSLGVKAMDRLKDKILDVGESVLKGITQPVSDAFNQIVTGGMNRATKVDQAKFKMSGLGVNWDDIKADIDYGVKDTAFGLDQAASAAANLVSVGIDFGATYGDSANSPMGKALRGISGLSAMFNRSYDDIAGLYQVIGAAGHVTNDALSRFTERGIPVVSELARKFNTSEEAIKEMAKEGSISVQEFIDVMDTAFGPQAKKANETFEGAFDNMNAALSRTGEKFAESYRHNMVNVYKALRLTINAFNGSDASNLMPLVQAFDAVLRDIGDRVTAISESIQEIFINSGAWKKTVEAVADIVEGVWSIIATIIDSFGELSGGTENLVKMADKLSDFASRFRELAQSESFIHKVQESVWALKEVFSDVGSVLKPILNMVALIGREMTFWASPMANINEGQSGLVHFINLLHNVVGVFTSFLKSDLFRDIFNVALAALGTIMHLFTSIGRIVSRLAEAIRTAIASVFGQNSEVTDFGETLARVFDIFHNWIDRLTPSAKFFEGLGKIFQGVLSVVKLLGKAFSALVNPILNLFDSFSGGTDKVFGGFWDILGTGLGFIGNLIVKITEWIDKTNILSAVQDFLVSAIDKVVAVVKSVAGWFKNVASTAGEWGKSIIEWAKPIGKNIIDWVVSAFKTAVEWIKIAIDWIKRMAQAFNGWLKDKTGYSFGEIIEKIGEAIKNVWEKIKGFFSNFPTWVKTAKDAFSGWVESVKGSSFGDFFDKVKESVKGVWENIKGLFDKTADDTSVSRAIDNMSPFAKVWESIKNVFSGVFKFFKAVWPVFEVIFIGIANVVAGVFNTLSNMMNNIDWEQFNLAEVLTGGGLAAGGAGIFILFKKIKEFLDGLMNPAKGFKNTFFGQITGTLGAVKGVLTEYQKQIKADVIMTIAKAIAILAGSIFVLALVDPDRITLAGTAVAGLLKILGDIITEIYSLSDKGSRDTDTGFAKMSLGFVLLAAGVMLLTFAIAKIAKIKIEDLVVGLLALHVLLFEVTNVLTKLANTDNTNIEGLGVTLLLLAFTVGKFVKPVKVLGSMNIMQLLQGIIALQMVMKILSDTFELLDKTSKAWSSAKAMTQAVKMIEALAVSMALMVIPVKLLGGMDTANLGRGLLAVAALIGIMTLAMKMLMKEKETLKGDKLSSTKNGSLEGVAGALLALAASLLLLMVPLKMLASMGSGAWTAIGQLGAMIAGLLLMIGLFTKFGGESKKAVLVGVVIAGMALALRLLITPLKEMMALGKDAWTAIGQIGAILGGVLLLLGLFNQFGTKDTGNSANMLAAAASLVIMAFALKLLMQPIGDLVALGKDAWTGILQALAILGGTLVLLAIVGKPAGKAMLIIAAAFLVLGLATVAVGAGLLLITGALSALSLVAGPAGIAIKILLMAIATSIPLITQQLANALNIAVKGLLKAVELLLAGIILLVQAIIDPLLGLVSKLLSGILALIVKFVKDLIASLKVIIYDIRDFIYEVKDTVVDTAKVFLDVLYDLLLEINTFLENAEDVISNHIVPAIARIIVQAVNTIMAVLAYYFPSIVESVRVILDSLIQLLIDITPRIGEWLLSLLNMVFDLLDASLPRIEQFLIRLCMVIVNVSPYLAAAVITLLNTILNMLPIIAHNAIEAIVKTLLIIFDGIGNRAQEIVDAALDMIWKVLVAIFVGLYKFIDRAVDAIAELVADVWPRIKAWFKKKWAEVKHTVKEWGKSIWAWIKGEEYEAEPFLYESGEDGVEAIFEGMADAAKDSSSVGEDITTNVAKGAYRNSDDLYETGEDLSTTLLTGAESQATSGRSLDIGSVISGGMAQGATSLSGVLSNTGEGLTSTLLGGSMTSAVANRGLAVTTGQVIPEGMIEGASGYSNVLQQTGEGNVTDMIVGAAKAVIHRKKDSNAIGETFVNDIADGVEKSKPKLARKADQVYDAINAERLASMSFDFQLAGEDENGHAIYEMVPIEKVKEAGAEVGRTYVEAVHQEVQDNMVNGFLNMRQAEDGGWEIIPKEELETAGEEAEEAYGEGMVKTATKYEEVLSAVWKQNGTSSGTAFLDSAKESLSGFDFNSLLGGDETNGIATRITPVISSEDESSLNLFSNGTLDVSSMWTSDGGTNVQESLMSIQENQNNDTTASEVVSLKEELIALRSALEVMINDNSTFIVNDLGPRVSSLEQAMYNMQVVMDTNAVVGQITPKIDESLGRRATYKGRGN